MNKELDHVAVAKTDIPSGAILKNNGNSIRIRDTIKKGHRFALRNIKTVSLLDSMDMHLPGLRES